LVAQAWNSMNVWNSDGTAVPGWPLVTGVFTSNGPALVDLDGDGEVDILHTQGTQLVARRLDGTILPGWPRFAQEDFQAPSFGDIDGDGEVEVVAGTWRPQFPDTVPFQVYAWNADGSEVPGFPVEGLGSVRGPVTLGDLDGDGSVELVVRAGDILHVFDASGAERPGWPVDPGGPIRNATPTIGDLDGDGDLEIVTAGFDAYAYHDDGTAVAGFPVGTGAAGNMNSGAAIADVDGEPATLEILLKIPNNIVGLNSDGTDAPGFPIPLTDNNASGTFSPGPAVGDLDGDGDVEIVAVSNDGTIALFDEPRAFTPGGLQWPQFGYDNVNSSFLPRDKKCAADINGDGSLNILDFVAFQTLFQNGEPDADCNTDGAFNILDFTCYQALFQAGCR